MPTLIYHITHLENLASILSSDGLLAVNFLRAGGLTYTNLAYENIQDRRARISVPCGAGGVLHDYVPFHFAPRSPMLYTLYRGNVPGYEDGQSSIIHLVSSVEKVHQSDRPFTFTDGHAIMNYSDFYDDINLLDQVIDWEVMEAKYWNDTDDDPNRRCKRQAEFLIHEFVPWDLIIGIGVINQTIQQEVWKILQTADQDSPVRVRSTWYY